jgi:CUB/sushi domain-containing protein
MTCLPTGDWDIDPPQCIKPDCGKVIELNNGIIFGLKNLTNGTEVNFSCDNGYHKISKSKLQCSLNGQWTGRIPICSKYECLSLPLIEHGIISAKPHDDSYVQKYTCEPQYEIVGEKSLICLPDNTWSAPAPRCRLAFCSHVPHIPKMSYKKQKMRLGETLQFACQTGFQLMGDPFIKCNHNGLWEKSFPSCKPRTCKVKQNIRHGRWTLIPSDFKKKIWSQGGSITQYDDPSVVSVGDKISVLCDPGYEVYGSEVTECLPTTVLDSPMSKCRQSYCPALRNIEHGFLVNGATYKGASVTYRCRPGYKLQGQSKRKCRRNKTWSGGVPKCKIMHCPEPHDMAHGEVEYNRKSLVYRTEIRYSCHLGYEMVGASTRVCDQDGQWQGPEPECTQIRCSVPKIPLHGEQEIQDLIVGGTISYNCNHGYRVTGNRILTCLGNKTWSGPVPRCERIFCKEPQEITNGKVILTSLEYQANIEYRCSAGYNLAGHHTRSCLHTGLWSGPQPSCVANLCPRVDISHAHVHIEGRVPGDVITVTCDPGYNLRGAMRLVCQMSLDWTPRPPTCEMVNCGNPPGVEYAVAEAGGFLYLDTAQYTCLPGYEMRGNNKLTCSADGKWSGVAPSCVPKPCGHLDPPKNANVKFESPSGYDLGFGSKAYMECIPGYVSLKASVLTCHEDGSWRGDVYQCLPVPCGRPPAPENGLVQVWLKGGQYLAEYRCDRGYTLEGAEYLRCMSDLQWQFGM